MDTGAVSELDEKTSPTTRTADELGDCRQRGLDGLDRSPALKLPELERLATGYCKRKGLELHGRIAQIKRLLRDAIDTYRTQGNRTDADLIDELFFGDPKEPMSASELLQRAQDKRHVGESTFRETRRKTFLRFADFLIEFAAKPSRVRFAVGVVAAVLALTGISAAIWLTVRGSQGDHTAPTPTQSITVQPTVSFVPTRTYKETAGARVGSNTYRNPYTIDHAGQRIPFLKNVQVACKVRAPTMPSVDYWYLVETEPWKNTYSPANSFLNGDPVKGPYNHDVDEAVPDCPPGVPPNP